MELTCNFGSFSCSGSTLYGCVINDPWITEPKTCISNVTGVHQKDKDDEKVKGVIFNKPVVHYFPIGLRDIFRYMKALIVSGCGLKSISREDLIGMDHLELLCMKRNELQMLPSDLFFGMKKLRKISFSGNKIRIMSSKLLKEIARNDLKLVNFRNNTSINALYKPEDPESVTYLKDLMAIIDRDCEPPPCKATDTEFALSLAENVASMWQLRDSADFTVLAGQPGMSEGLKVHKFILVSQSAVFASMIYKNEEKLMNTITIPDHGSRVIESMLYFMYTGKIYAKSIALNLYIAGERYGLDILRERARKIIIDDLHMCNAIEVFRIADRFEDLELKEAAFDFMKGVIDISEDLFYKTESLIVLIDAYREVQDKKDNPGEKEDEFEEEET